MTSPLWTLETLHFDLWPGRNVPSRFPFLSVILQQLMQDEWMQATCLWICLWCKHSPKAVSSRYMKQDWLKLLFCCWSANPPAVLQAAAVCCQHEPQPCVMSLLNTHTHSHTDIHADRGVNAYMFTCLHFESHSWMFFENFPLCTTRSPFFVLTCVCVRVWWWVAVVTKRIYSSNQRARPASTSDQHLTQAHAV